MTLATQNVTDMPASELEALDAALADFDLEGDDAVIEEPADETLEGEVIEGEVVETASSEVLDEDELRDLDIAIERTEAYNAQSAAPADPTAQPASGKPAKKARAPKAADGTKTAPVRTPRDISTVASDVFVLTGDVAAMDDTAKDAAKVATLALKPTQVKIAEKFENLFTSLSVGKAPSTYVMIAFKLLDEKKTVTSADIVGAYKASGLGEGTARSQCGQIMALFATVGVASRVGQSLTLLASSNVADRLRKLA